MLKEYFNSITEFERESDEYWNYLSSIAIDNPDMDDVTGETSVNEEDAKCI